MGFLRAIALKQSGRRERVLGRERKPQSDGVSSSSLIKQRGLRRHFPLKKKLTYSSWLVCPTRASVYVPLARVSTAHPFGRLPLIRVMREVRSERYERLVPSDARGSFRAMRKARSERYERFVPSYARGSFRAMRKVRAGRYERFEQGDAKGSSRAMRKVRAGRYERFVPSDANGSSRAEGSIPFICRERVAAIRAV